MKIKRLFLQLDDRTPVPAIARVMGIAAVFALLAAVLSFTFQQSIYQWDWAGVWAYRRKLVAGWLHTVALSACSLALATLLGLCCALIRRSRLLAARYTAVFYVELIRGTPLLAQIYVFFYAIANAAGAQNRYVAGVAILSIFSGAYISEIIRGGIESIAGSQLESARAVGFTRAQIYRYVIFPQALRQTLPALAGQFASLVKDSSLLSIIGISEFTLNAREIASYTLSPFESYLPLAAGYLLLTLPISLWMRSLEARSRYET